MPEVIFVPHSDKKGGAKAGRLRERVVYEPGDYLKAAETILVPTSPGESKRRSHGAGADIASEGRGSGELESDA